MDTVDFISFTSLANEIFLGHGYLSLCYLFYFCIRMDEERKNITPEDMAAAIRRLSSHLTQMGRTDLLLKAIGVPMLEQLHIEAAKATLSKLVITSDFRFLLPDYNKEVCLSPLHKALYILFLRHPEGIEFKNLVDHREELLSLYQMMGNRIDKQKIKESINRLVNPLDNAINEKCSRIKLAFSELMNEYQAEYYIINSHTVRHMSASNQLWFERLKIVNLPRNLVVWKGDEI